MTPVQIEDLSSCEKKLKFVVSKDIVNEKIDHALKHLQKGVKMKGFRKGKAPISLVSKMYWDQVKSDVIQEIVQHSYQDAVREHKIHPVGYPKVNTEKLDRDADFEFDATVDTYPIFDLPKLEKIKVQEEKAIVEESEIEENIKQIRTHHSVMKPVEDGRAAAKGDFVEIDFKGKLVESGEEPDTMKGEAMLVELGAEKFIPGFEEALMGAKAGEDKEINTSFPEDYHAKDIAGKKVTFSVKVNEVKFRELPEVNEEFAKSVDFESVDDMKTKIRESIQNGKEHEALQKMKDELLKNIIEKAEINVPQSMVNNQKAHMVEDLKNNLKQRGANDVMLEEYVSKWGGDLDDQALTQVKKALILEKVAEDQNVEATEEKLDEHYEKMGKLYGMEKDQLKEMMKADQARLDSIKLQVREEMTFDYLFSIVKKVEKKEKSGKGLFGKRS